MFVKTVEAHEITEEESLTRKGKKEIAGQNLWECLHLEKNKTEIQKKQTVVVLQDIRS